MVDPATLSDAELSAICAVHPQEKQLVWVFVLIGWVTWIVVFQFWSPVQDHGFAGGILGFLFIILSSLALTYLGSVPYRWRTARYQRELFQRCDLPGFEEDLLLYIKKRTVFDNAEWVVLLDARFLPHGGRLFVRLALEKATSASLQVSSCSFEGQNLSRAIVPLTAKATDDIRRQLEILAENGSHFVPRESCADGLPLRLIAHQPSKGLTRRYTFNFACVSDEQKSIPVVILVSALMDAIFGKETEMVYASCDVSGKVVVNEK